MNAYGLGLAHARSPVGIAVPVATPLLTAVDASGWSAQWLGGTPPALLPDTSPRTVPVTRQGFDASGAAATVTDTRTITTRVRAAYPTQPVGAIGTTATAWTATTVALDDYVYSTDTLPGVTNSSTETSPKPIAAWAMPSRLLVGNSIAWEIVAFHRDFRANRMVACVQVQATDGTTTTAWQTVSTTAISSLCEDANPIEVYRGTLDISALATGVITLRARVFPWIGAAASVLDSADQSVAREFGPRHFLKNVARAAAPPIAYVSSSGSDTTGSWSSDDATAYATPFASIKGALDAADNSTRGIKASFPGGMALGLLDGARIRITGTASAGGAPTVNRAQNLAALVIERDPRISRATAIVSGAVSPKLANSLVTEAGTEGAILFYDVSLTRGTTTFAGSTTNNLRVMLWNMTLTTTSNVTWLSNSHGYYFGVVVSGATKSFSPQTGVENRVIRGCTFDAAATNVEVWWNLGNTITNCNGAGALDPSKGGIWYGNRWPAAAATNGMIGGMLGGTAVGQLAVVQNVIEPIHTTSTAVSIGISNDGGSANTAHVIVAYNTATGYGSLGRWNLFYDEAPGTTRRTHRLARVVGNIAPQLNQKGDLFMAGSGSTAEAPNRTGHMPLHHGVGAQGNLALYRVNSGAYLSEYQLYPGMRSEVGTNPDNPLYAMSAVWTNYQGTTGSGGTPTAGTGGGTYTLVSGSPARGKVIAPGLRFDLAGMARPASGDSAGAYA